MLWNDLTDTFLATRKRGTEGAKRPAGRSTISNYQADIGQFTGFMETQGVIRYDQMKKLHLDAFFDFLVSKYTSQASRNHHMRSMKAFIRWIDQNEDIQEDARLLGHPLRSFVKYIPKIPKNLPRQFIPSPKQAAAFKAAFKTDRKSGFRDYVIFCLTFDTGMRIGEVRWLRLNNLFMEELYIEVPQEGKTGSRLVEITEDVARLLKRWLRVRGTFAKCDFVFTTQSGTQLSDERVCANFLRLRKKHGLAPITPHTNRHAFCTYWLEQHGDIAKLKRMTGHTTYDMLENYLKLSHKSVQSELERVSPLRQISEQPARR